MKNLLEKTTHDEILARVGALTNTTAAQWGKMMYKHLDHHLRQFGA